MYEYPFVHMHVITHDKLASSTPQRVVLRLHVLSWYGTVLHMGIWHMHTSSTRDLPVPQDAFKPPTFHQHPFICFGGTRYNGACTRAGVGPTLFVHVRFFECKSYQ